MPVSIQEFKRTEVMIEPMKKALDELMSIKKQNNILGSIQIVLDVPMLEELKPERSTTAIRARFN